MRCLASSPWTNASTFSSASSAAGSLFPVTSATAPKTQSTTVAIFRILSPPTDACLTERASPAFQFQNPNPIPRQLPTKQRLSILGLKFSRRVVHQLASRSQWPGQAPRNHQVRRILRMVSRTAAGKATAAQRPALTTRQNFIEKTPKGRLSILRKMFFSWSDVSRFSVRAGGPPKQSKEPSAIAPTRSGPPCERWEAVARAGKRHVRAMGKIIQQPMCREQCANHRRRAKVAPPEKICSAEQQTPHQLQQQAMRYGIGDEIERSDPRGPRHNPHLFDAQEKQYLPKAIGELRGQYQRA